VLPRSSSRNAKFPPGLIARSAGGSLNSGDPKGDPRLSRAWWVWASFVGLYRRAPASATKGWHRWASIHCCAALPCLCKTLLDTRTKSSHALHSRFSDEAENRKLAPGARKSQRLRTGVEQALETFQRVPQNRHRTGTQNFFRERRRLSDPMLNECLRTGI
jgi:hypothetical protein